LIRFIGNKSYSVHKKNPVQLYMAYQFVVCYQTNKPVFAVRGIIINVRINPNLTTCWQIYSFWKVEHIHLKTFQSSSRSSQYWALHSNFSLYIKFSLLMKHLNFVFVNYFLFFDGIVQHRSSVKLNRFVFGELTSSQFCKSVSWVTDWQVVSKGC